jgi:hypothetical protein
MRSGIDSLQRYRDPQLGAAGRPGFDFQRPSKRSDTLPNADEPETVRGRGRTPASHADAVVPDRTPDAIGFDPQIHPDPRGASVLDRVGESLLHDSVERDLERAGKAPSARRALDPNRDPGSLGDAVAEELKRGHEAKIIQDRGAKLVRDPADLLFDLVEMSPDLADARARARHLTLEPIEGDMRAGKELPRRVMEFVRDPRGFSFQNLVLAAQGGARAPRCAISKGERLSRRKPSSPSRARATPSGARLVEQAAISARWTITAMSRTPNPSPNARRPIS